MLFVPAQNRPRLAREQCSMYHTVDLIVCAFLLIQRNDVIGAVIL